MELKLEVSVRALLKDQPQISAAAPAIGQIWIVDRGLTGVVSDIRYKPVTQKRRKFRFCPAVLSNQSSCLVSCFLKETQERTFECMFQRVAERKGSAAG